MKVIAQIGDMRLSYTREGTGARLLRLHGGMGIDSGCLRVAGSYKAAFGRELAQYDLRAKVRAISVPTLLIVGSEDHYRAQMECMAEVMPAARLHVLQRVGHFPFVEAQEEFLEIVAGFVAEHASFDQKPHSSEKKA